jgi:ATPase family associated with various cellular activities (AAA)
MRPAERRPGNSPEARPLLAVICERVRMAASLVLADGAREDAKTLLNAREASETELENHPNSGLRRLRDIFRLSLAECDVLSTCLALAMDPALANLFRDVMQSDGRGYVTSALVSRLFDHSPALLWNPAGSLALWALVTAHPVGPGEPEALAVDPVVPAWLEGALWIDRSLAGLVRNSEAQISLPSWPVQTVAAQIRRALLLGKPIRIAIHGEAGSGGSALATAAAKAANLPSLIVDTTDIADCDWTDRFVRLQRLAAISGTALIWTGHNVARPWPTLVAPAPSHFVVMTPEANLRPLASVATHRVDMPLPTIDERRQLWLELIPEASAWPAAELDALTLHYRLGADDIATICDHAPQDAAAAAALVRASHQGSGDEVVSAIPCPFTWEDLVLPAALKNALAEFAFEAAERERLWESSVARRLFPREIGLVALFSGPSGTGKTMAAQVIAAELQLDLLRVDLAAVVSKYIGETAKNLNKVFALARQRQAILLFDEADAHFARRTEVKDAHDRYANADTNHLLQLIEAHVGVVILATNRRSDMDPAFTRRLRHVLEFPRPQPTERQQLWRRSISEIAAEHWSGLARGMAEVADAVDLTGAQIKHASLSALFAARREQTGLSFPHILHGIDRELAKEGRPLSPKDKERWLRHV